MRTVMPPLSIIVAVDLDGGFGKDGKIPWHFKEDFDHFKEVTKGSICIMGRKTYEDMWAMVKARKVKINEKAIEEYETIQNNGEKPKGKKPTIEPITEILPGRECYVVTRDENYVAEGATAVTSIRKATEFQDEDDTREVFILGGYRMFVEGLSWTNKVYMTVIKDRYNCDVFFPIKALEQFTITDGRQTEELDFITYTK